MPEESELTLALDGGIVSTALDDVIQPPSLKQSDNTRLSIVRGTVTATSAPVSILSVTAGAECGGIVAAGQVGSAVAFFDGSGGHTRRIAGGAVNVLQSTLQAPAVQNAYRPAQISKAGVLPGTLELRSPVVTVHQGLRVFASLRRIATTATHVGIYITALDAEGQVIVAPVLACDLGAEASPNLLISTLWVALTSHGSFGLRLWYTRGGHVRRRSLSISGLDLTVGAEVDHGITGTAVGYQIDVCSGVDDTAFLVHFKDDLSLTYLDKTNITSDTFTRATLANNAAGPVAIAHLITPSFPYVAVTYQSSNWFKAVWRADTFVEVWHALTAASGANSYSAAQFLVQADGTTYVLFATSRDGDFSRLPVDGIVLSSVSVQTQACALLTGTIAAHAEKFWMRLADRGATIAVGAVEQLPVFTLARSYNFEAGADITSVDYLPDPSLELYSVIFGVTGRLHMAPIARFGVDLALRGQSPLAAIPAILGSNTAAVDTAGTRKLVVTYLAENFEISREAVGHMPRFVEIDLTPRQPRFVNDTSGVALIAAGQPATWDGVEVVEAGPLHQVKVCDASALFPLGAGGGDALVGTFLFRVVVSWRDAAGDVHRSSPSLPVMVIGTSGTPAYPYLFITVPETLRDGISQELYDMTIYQAGPVADGTPDADSNYWARTDYLINPDGRYGSYDAILKDHPDDSTLLYSTGTDGEELLPEAPPPLWDAAMVGLRAWGIHAELRRRAVHTKKKEIGIALEWNGALYIDLPAASGDLIAVTELDGKPVFLGERGVYIIDGEGPDNTGLGSYGDPRCLANVGCSSRESVVRFPGGVIFQSGARFVVMQSGGGIQYVDEIDASLFSEITAAAVLTRGQEVAIIPRTATLQRALVYNFALNRWTTWSAWPRLAAFALASKTRALGFDYYAHEIVVLDVDVPGATQIVQETGWLAPAGPQGNANMHELFIQGVWQGGYFLLVEVFQDFAPDSDPAFNVVYSAADLLEACDGKSRFTLRCALDQPISRAIRVRLTAESITTAPVKWQPVAITIAMGVSPGQLRRNVLAGMK